jgi:hypothetical protein
MTQGLPPKPTCFSIVSGILLAIAVLAAFAFLPNIVKWVGAVFTFVPGQLGLIDVVTPDEVMPVDMIASPTEIEFVRAGEYAVFTANMDLLTIHEAVLDAKAKPWFRLADSDEQLIAVTLVERGLALYDTPLAAGRPVALFEIPAAGTYTMTHPRREDFVYVVPDTTTGNEGAIGAYMVAQAIALGFGGWYLRRKLRKPPTKIVAPPPSPLARQRYRAEQAASERPATLPTRPSRAAAAQPEPVADEASAPDARDVLQMVHDGQLTLANAEAEIEARFLAQPAGAPNTNWGASLALATYEATAYAQGAGTHDLLKLRYEGWPSVCTKCGQPLDFKQLGWWFVRDDQGRPGLRHIDCAPGKATHSRAR